MSDYDQIRKTNTPQPTPAASAPVPTMEELLEYAEVRFDTMLDGARHLAERLHAALARVAELERAVASMTLESLTGGERDAAEIERLRTIINTTGRVQEATAPLKAELSRLRAELKWFMEHDAKLTAENDRLRAAAKSWHECEGQYQEDARDDNAELSRLREQHAESYREQASEILRLREGLREILLAPIGDHRDAIRRLLGDPS